MQVAELDVAERGCGAHPHCNLCFIFKLWCVSAQAGREGEGRGSGHSYGGGGGGAGGSNPGAESRAEGAEDAGHALPRAWRALGPVQALFRLAGGGPCGKVSALPCQAGGTLGPVWALGACSTVPQRLSGGWSHVGRAVLDMLDGFWPAHDVSTRVVLIGKMTESARLDWRRQSSTYETDPSRLERILHDISRKQESSIASVMYVQQLLTGAVRGVAAAYVSDLELCIQLLLPALAVWPQVLVRQAGACLAAPPCYGCIPWDMCGA